MAIQRFPKLAHQREDDNPAIQMFGRRFYKDQTVVEYLAEFLLVFTSRKQIAGADWTWERTFPDTASLKAWPESKPLWYAPPARLVLKLFSFLGSSKLETRHECHYAHFHKIFAELQRRIELPSPPYTKKQVLDLLEQLLTGFTGVAKSRTWCTHTFLPIAPSLIAREAIWKRLEGTQQLNTTWNNAVTDIFVYSNHDFMARGGEILYLQLCNLFRRTEDGELSDLEQELGHAKGTAIALRSRIEAGINNLFESTSAIDKLARWIGSADPETEKMVDEEVFRPMKCGWCPAESWREAYLFAYEMANICDALVDPLEKIELLKLCCVLQVLRSLCSQSARYWNGLSEDVAKLGGANGFAWIVTHPQSDDPVLREAANRNLVRIQEMIHGAIRHPDILLNSEYKNKPSKYKDADEQAQELFIKLAKTLEFVVPYKGPNPRFALNEHLLRYFVLALIPPGKRMTLSSFQERLFQHYGIAADGPLLNRAVRWSFPDQDFILHSVEQSWFEEKLRATGFLIPLSDAVSLVQNPFGQSEKAQRQEVAL